jgi:DNA modification methylase
VLNGEIAREDADERHICPLQLDVIERALHMWSAKDDLVFSPFTGIGSEGYCSVKMGRRFVGSELKTSYWKTAIDNLRRADVESKDLFQ